MRWILVVGVACLCLALSRSVIGTLSKDDKKKPGSKEPQVNPSTETVVKRGLVSTKVKATEIVKEHQTYCDTEREIKHFAAETLAYVTPWNSRGYEVAKLFAHKFSYVSPVWLQIQRRSDASYSVNGAHDIDKEWMAEVSDGGKVKIVPRVLFDSWTAEDFSALFSSEHEQDVCSQTLLHFLQKHGFHGMVLEIWTQVLDTRLRGDLVHFVIHVGEDMQDAGLSLLTVLPPPVGLGNEGNGAVMQAEFELIAPYVTAFSLMTYDYSHPQRAGPTSPLHWVKACIEYLVPNPASPYRRKLLLGLNFYGSHFFFNGGSPIIGSQYIDMLSRYKPKILWNSDVKEHVFTFKNRDGDHIVYYPTLQSISDRLKLAESLGTGVSIWEIGQGLDYFYDLL